MLSEFPNGITRSTAYANSNARDFSHCQGAQDQFDERKLGMSVAVKASWFPVRADSKIAIFDTSAAGMKKYLNEGEFLAVGTVPGTDALFRDIYSISVRPNIDADKKINLGLAAAHFAIKQFPDWMWIVVDFQDSKDSMDAEFRRKFPLLTASLDETFDNPNTNAGNSWCSNPFIERRKFNARTNCIGCHQHAGAGVDAEAVFNGDESVYPHSSRLKVRKNLMADYLYSFDQDPDQFQHEIGEIVRSREAGLP